MTDLPDRLNQFMETWLSNPAAQLQFALLVREVLNVKDDATFYRVRDWVNEQRRLARAIGCSEAEAR